MRNIAYFVFTAFVCFGMSEQSFALDTLKVDQSHSSVIFSIRHIFSRVHGRFSTYDGSVVYDSTSLEKSFISIVLQAKSINTDNQNRDEDLRSPNFFSTDSFPTATFTSKRFFKSKEGMFVEGKLTIHGITKEITAPVEVLGYASSKERVFGGFRSEFKINRKDFGIVWNRTLDIGGTLLGDEVTITVDVEARMQKG